MREIEGFQFKDELLVKDFLEMRKKFPKFGEESDAGDTMVQNVELVRLMADAPLDVESLPLSTMLKIMQELASKNV